MRKRTKFITAAIFGLAALTGMKISEKQAYSEIKIPATAKPISSFYEPVRRDPFNEKEFIKTELKKIARYKVDNFNEDSTTIILARMILGEAADCSQLEKIAVAYTAINRMNNSKQSERLKEVILKPRQYSCFNENKASSTKFLKDPLKYDGKEFLSCLELAEDILLGRYNDPTKGATHYYNPDLVKTPKWAKEYENLKKIGHHIFFKE